MLLGVSELREPMEMVYRDGEALAELVASLLDAGRPVFLERVPADAPTLVAIEQAARGAGGGDPAGAPGVSVYCAGCELRERKRI